MKAALFANGRAFNLMNEGEPRRPRWALISREAFNGLVLWKRDLASSNQRAVIAVGKRVFTVLEKDGPLVALDAATGKVVRTYEVGVSPFIVLNIDGNLILGDKKQICSVNANTGVVNWRALADKDAPFRNADRKLQPGSDSNDKLALMVAGSGRLFVFVQDSLAPPFIGIVPFHSLAADEALGIIELLRIANAKSLCILEQARFVDELKSVHKMSISEVTRLVERSKGWVGMRVGLIGEMSKTVMDKIFSGKFPIYSYMYTIRSFMRMNGIKKEEVDEFVASVSDKGLSLRDIEMLATDILKVGKIYANRLKAAISHGA
jgi:hypothetical protein